MIGRSARPCRATCRARGSRAPSRSPTALHCSRWRAASAQVSCRFSSGAPDSSNWPAGSRLMVPSGPDSAMTLPFSIDRLPAELGQADEQVADAAGLVPGRRAMVVGRDRRTSHARCRCAIARAASRRRRRPRADRRGSRQRASRAYRRCAASFAAALSRALQAAPALPIYGLIIAPVAGDRHIGGERGQRGGLGAQDARAERDRHRVGAARIAARSSSVKPPSGPVRMVAGPGLNADAAGSPPASSAK